MSDHVSKIVGILGGMGPAATVDFYAKLVRLTPATRDQDHIRVVIWADPTVPSRQDAILKGGKDLGPSLRKGLDNLVACGAQIIVTPCNTVHAVLPPIVAEYPVEFINIVTSALNTLQAQVDVSDGPVGLLATEGALAAGIYQEALMALGFAVKTPSSESQASLMDVVNEVKAGRVDLKVVRSVEGILGELTDQGIASAIIACTEISAIIERCKVPDEIFLLDPSVALASAAIERAASC